MSVFAVGGKHRGLAERRGTVAFWCIGTCLVCSLIAVVLGRIFSVAVAADGVSVRTPVEAKPVIHLGSEPYTFVASGDSKPNTEKVPNWTKLVTEKESPEDYKKIASESGYPPTDPPQNLTPEQLDAIAKLAPKANKAGKQVHPAMVPLFRSMVLNYNGGSYKNSPLRFRLHTPEPYQPGKKYPLVVWLHGAGECGDDNINQLSHLHHIIPYLVGPKKRDFFLLVPQCPHSHVSWEAPEICSTKVRGDGTVECHVVDDPVARGDAPVAFTLAMVDAVMKNFPVDPNRVTVGGLSTGGEGTWKILERRPDLFAAAVPVVSWQAMHEKSLRENPLLKKIPIWAVYSSDDRGIDFARKEFERMRDRGCHVFKTEFGVCGHRAWTPAMLQGDVFGWLISRAKDGDRYYAAEASPTNPEKIGIFADVTEGDLKGRVPTKAKARPKQAEKAEQSPTLAVPATEASLAPPAPPKRKRVPRQPDALASDAPPVPPVLGDFTQSPPAVGDTDANAATGVAPSYAYPPSAVDQLRMDLMVQYIAAGEVKKALAVADKVKQRKQLVMCLLHAPFDKPNGPEVLSYVDRELDRMEQLDRKAGPTLPRRARVEFSEQPVINEPARPAEAPLVPIPAGKITPKDECGKEWSMSTTTQYGLFPNGWEQEATHVPGYIVNETGKQLRDRLAKAFADDDLSTMKEFCESFIRLDDIPLSSPWFDTSGGRLEGRIKYTLNEKAKPVVSLLREIATVQAESKKEFAELARKSLERIDAITKPKATDLPKPAADDAHRDKVMPDPRNRSTMKGVPQVSLQVEILELSATKMEKLGMNWKMLIFGYPEVSTTGKEGELSSQGLSIIDEGSPSQQFLSLLRKRNWVKVVTSPKILTRSGQIASVEADAFSVPKLHNGSVTMEQQSGTSLKMIPTIRGDSIQLRVHGQFAHLKDEGAVHHDKDTPPTVQCHAVTFNVKLQKGQTVVFSGPTKTGMVAESHGLPWISEIPFVGAAFSTVKETRNEIATVVLIHPEIQQP